jgi:hypothetical protein
MAHGSVVPKEPHPLPTRTVEEGQAMKSIMRIISLSAVLVALAGQPGLGNETRSNDSLYRYLAGKYIAVGKELNSERTYSGRVVLSYENDHLIVTRDVEGETLRGEGKIEHALGPDDAEVLRVRFSRSGKEYEITYVWRSDLDNHARLSGYVYRPGIQTDSPGMEALFIDHAKND